jgi:hypothetical protein
MKWWNAMTWKMYDTWKNEYEHRKIIWTIQLYTIAQLTQPNNYYLLLISLNMRRIVKSSCVAMRHAIISRNFSDGQCPFRVQLLRYERSRWHDWYCCRQCNFRNDNAMTQSSATVLSCEISLSLIQSYKLPVHHIDDDSQTKSCPFGIHHVKIGSPYGVVSRAASGRLRQTNS